jgi:prepilin-type processing-associated H-X9-DG protein
MFLMPFMEQQATYDNWNQSITTWTEPNQTLCNALRGVGYRCPSDEKPDNNLGNIVCCMGREYVYCCPYTGKADKTTSLVTSAGGNSNSTYKAAFDGSTEGAYELGLYPKAMTFATLKDGTSNTLAFSETIQGKNGATKKDGRGMIYDGMMCYFTTCTTPNSMTPDLSHPNFSVTGHLLHPFASIDTGTRATRFAARSWHTGGVNAALADGSGRFVNNTVAADVWAAAGGADDGEAKSLP